MTAATVVALSACLITALTAALLYDRPAVGIVAVVVLASVVWAAVVWAALAVVGGR